MSNFDRFRAELEQAYTRLFAEHPDYHAVAATMTPAAMAQKMADALRAGSAGIGSIQGDGVKAACKNLGVKRTFAAIARYLDQETS